jgi:hypothetical protein
LVQPDPVEEPDAVDDTPSGRFCSSSTVDEPDDVDDTPFGRFCSLSTVDELDDVDDTSSGPTHLFGEEKMAPLETVMAPNSERGRKLREGRKKKKKDLRKEKKERERKRKKEERENIIV